MRAPFSPGYPQFPEHRPFAALDGDPATHWQADRALDARPPLARGRLRRAARRRVRRPAAVRRPPREGDGGRGRRAARSPCARAGTGCRLGLRGVALAARSGSRVEQRAGRPDGRGRHPRAADPRRARDGGAAAAGARRARAGRARPRRAGADLPLPAHDGRRPVPPRPAARRAGAACSCATAWTASAASSASFSPPAARTWALDGWGTVDRARRPTRRSTRWSALAAARSTRRRASGPAGVPRLERVRRHAAALDRLLARRAHARGWSGPCGRGDAARVDARRRSRRAAADAGAAAERRAAVAAGRRRRRTARCGCRSRSRGRTVPARDPARGVRRGHARRRAAAPGGRASPRSAGRACRACGCRGRARSEPDCGDGGRRGRAGTPSRLRVEGTIADLDAGRPLRLRGCGARSTCRRARRGCRAAARARFAPYLLRLRSPAPEPAGRAPPARVACSTRAARSATAARASGSTCASPPGSCSAETYSARWRATCDGHDLGAPVPVDGFAMAWRVPAGCERAEMAFAPDRARARRLPRLAAVRCWRCSALLVIRAAPAASRSRCRPSCRSRRPSACPPRRAAVLALVAGARARLRVRGPRRAADRRSATFLILWRGVGVRALVRRRGRAAARRRAACSRSRSASRTAAATTPSTRRSGSPCTGSRRPRSSCWCWRWLGCSVQRDARDHQHDPGGLGGRRHLGEHHDADHRRGRGQQRRPSARRWRAAAGAIASWSET